MADGHIAAPLEAASLARHHHPECEPEAKHPILDRVGIGVSLTCAVHCIATAALSLVPAVAGSIAFLEWIEVPMLLIALVIGTVSLVPATRVHHHRGPVGLFAVGIALLLASRFAPGSAELVLTVAGFTPVALAHIWNLRLCHNGHAAAH